MAEILCHYGDGVYSVGSVVKMSDGKNHVCVDAGGQGEWLIGKVGSRTEGDIPQQQLRSVKRRRTRS